MARPSRVTDPMRENYPVRCIPGWASLEALQATSKTPVGEHDAKSAYWNAECFERGCQVQFGTRRLPHP